MTTARLRELFGELARALAPLGAAIRRAAADGRAPRVRAALLPAGGGDGEWPVAAQQALCGEIAEQMGFDLARGRIDVSAHPFTGGSHASDVRITTRYSATNWLEGLAGAVHEVGHALYEQGRPVDAYDGLPVARALSMGVHESQSLLWERMVFQSRAFWEFAAPRVRARFAHVGEDVGAAELYAAANVVAPGLIRVDADEVSYPLHIILRFELEQALFDGSLAVDDALPAAWNRRFEELVGLPVPDDARGVLQDVHWGAGAIGYFPSYTLGAIAAAQLFAAAKRPTTSAVAPSASMDE